MYLLSARRRKVNHGSSSFNVRGEYSGTCPRTNVGEFTPNVYICSTTARPIASRHG